MKKNALLFALFVGCIVVSGAAIIGYQDFSVISTPGNPASGYGRCWVATGLFSCKDSSGTALSFGGGSSPSGTAGGDLSGTYPNPTVAQVNGAVVPASAGGVKTNSSRQLIAQLAADVVGLFSGCSGTLLLGADGACHAGGAAAYTPVGSVACSGGAVCTTSTGYALVTTAGTTITFSSIPGTFNNLQIVACGRTTVSSTGDGVLGAFNGDTTAGNYALQYMQSAGSTVSGARISSSAGDIGSFSGNTSTAGRQGCFTSVIGGYAGTTFQKNAITQVLFDTGVSGSNTGQLGLFWFNTAAITSIVFTPSAGPNFIAGTYFSLYGF
jgi:hypothetical protein